MHSSNDPNGNFTEIRQLIFIELVSIHVKFSDMPRTSPVLRILPGIKLH